MHWFISAFILLFFPNSLNVKQVCLVVCLSFKHLPLSESNERAIFDGIGRSAQQSYYLVWPFSHLNDNLPSPRNTNINEVRSFFFLLYIFSLKYISCLSSHTLSLLRFSAVVFPSHANNHNSYVLLLVLPQPIYVDISTQWVG